jgi:hypothetical protein
LEGTKEIYRVAFETANAELTQIDAEFEKLRMRKEQVERLLTALRIFFGEEQTSGAGSQGASSETATTDEATLAEPNGKPQPVPSDPFQRRIDHVLGIGAGIRDVRKYTRQF